MTELYINKICNNFAPDSLAPEEDGIIWALVCSICLYHKLDHKLDEDKGKRIKGK